MDPSKLREKLDAYLTQDLSEKEFGEFWQSLHDMENLLIWDEAISEVWNNKALHGLSDTIIEDAAFSNVISRVSQASSLIQKRRSIFSYRYMVAASVFFILLSGGILFYSGTQNEANQLKPVGAMKQKLIQPGRQGAVLTLGDGKEILIDSAKEGIITHQADLNINLDSGTLYYSSRSNTISYNKLETPRGFRFRIKLSDGTMVWLNAASSIRFPSAFTGKQRLVEVTGEAYFEVVPDENKPFEVKTPRSHITVLGTSFNINSYDDEPSAIATVQSGRIKVEGRQRSQSSVVLGGGQQALLNVDGIRTQEVDASSAIAWVNGVFQMTGKDLTTVMRQVARWYDVRVEYNGHPNVKLRGSTYQSKELSEIIELISFASGAKIIVSEANRTIYITKN